MGEKQCCQRIEVLFSIHKCKKDYALTIKSHLTGIDATQLRNVSLISTKQRKTKLFRDKINLPPDDKKVIEDEERGETDLVQMHIDTADVVPVKQISRRMPFAVRQEVASQVRKMREAGVVQSSTSPWSSPVISVKKNGSYRFITGNSMRSLRKTLFLYHDLMIFWINNY